MEDSRGSCNSRAHMVTRWYQTPCFALRQFDNSCNPKSPARSSHFCFVIASIFRSLRKYDRNVVSKSTRFRIKEEACFMVCQWMIQIFSLCQTFRLIAGAAVEKTGSAKREDHPKNGTAGPGKIETLQRLLGQGAGVVFFVEVVEVAGFGYNPGGRVLGLCAPS